MPQLPFDIWRRRIESEYGQLRGRGFDFDVSPDRTEYLFRIRGDALCVQGGRLVAIRDHEVSLKLGREYPYAGGFELAWRTPIFHPNIDEKGRVCIRLVNLWAAGQTLASIVDALVQLLENPNPDSPLNYDAARHYLENPKRKEAGGLKRSRPRIIG
jgi:ubiquitin-protein ligase